MEGPTLTLRIVLTKWILPVGPNDCFNLFLLELYTVVSTCYNHEGMEFCPVLVKI